MVLVDASVWVRFLAGKEPYATELDLYGRGLGWVDVHLLASTLIEKAHLSTADEGLARVAREAGVAHELCGNA